MTSQDPTFSGFVKASGQTNQTSVTLRQTGGGPSSDLQCAGLRTYSDGIRIANWNEEEYAVNSMLKHTPLPSQFGHQYESTYRASYNKSKTPVKVPQFIKELPDAPCKVCVSVCLHVECVCVCART